jgi:hypothetical protein
MRPSLTCSCQARQYPLPNHGALELGKNAHHLEHGSAAWGRGVQPLLMQVQINLLGMKLGQQFKQAGE